MYQILKKAAQEAAKIQLAYFRTAEMDITHKTDHQNIVTAADKKSQKIIEEILIQEMNKIGFHEQEVGFVGEEDLQTEGSHIFVIDPIDGTSNFASGIDYFCTSIAYYNNGILDAGLIYRPVHQELYFAKKGEGAFIELYDRREVLKMKDLDSQNMIMSTNFGETMRNSDQLPLIERLMPLYRGVRAFGAVALDLAKVSNNEIGTSVDKGPYLWDISAGKIIIEEAGGCVFDWEGQDLDLDLNDRKKRYSLIACHPAKKKMVLNYVRT